MFTIEERRRLMLEFVKNRDDKNKEVAIGLLEEIFSMADSWRLMASALNDMARTQEEQLELQKRIFVVPVQKQEKH